MAVVIDGVAKTFTVTAQTVVNVRKELFSAWMVWRKVSDNAKYLTAMRPVGGDSIGAGNESPNFFFLMNDWKIVVDGVVATFQYNLYCEEATNTNYVPFVYVNGGNSTNEVSSSPIVTVAGGSGLSQTEHETLMATATKSDVYSASIVGAVI